MLTISVANYISRKYDSRIDEKMVFVVLISVHKPCHRIQNNIYVKPSQLNFLVLKQDIKCLFHLSKFTLMAMSLTDSKSVFPGIHYLEKLKSA